MQLVLSGFAGVGKSSIVELTQKEYKNVSLLFYIDYMSK